VNGVGTEPTVLTESPMCFELFLDGLLSTAQSYPSLSPSNNSSGPSGVAPSAGAQGLLGHALTMSLTSTSSDSEQVSLRVG